MGYKIASCPHNNKGEMQIKNKQTDNWKIKKKRQKVFLMLHQYFRHSVYPSVCLLQRKVVFQFYSFRARVSRNEPECTDISYNFHLSADFSYFILQQKLLHPYK